MKQMLVLIAIVILPSLISCDSEARGLSSRGLFERLVSNYDKIKRAKVTSEVTETDIVQDGMRLFIDMGEPWSYFLIRGLLPGNDRKNLLLMLSFSMRNQQNSSWSQKQLA